MKSFILIAVLVALTVCNEAASISDEAAQFVEDIIEMPEEDIQYEQTKDYNLEGVTGRQLSRDDEFILFYEESYNLEPIPQTVQYRDIFYRGNSTTNIRQLSISYHPFAGPSHIFTGMYITHAHVRLTSRVGEGLLGSVRIYGRYTDWS